MPDNPSAPRRLLDDLQFGESPRWHGDRLWFSDILDGKVYTATMAGDRTLMADFGAARPSGIGFLPDGDALIVDMGMPGIVRLAADRKPDLLVTVDVAVPASLSDAEREAVEALRVARGGRDPREDLFKAVKS